MCLGCTLLKNYLNLSKNLPCETKYSEGILFELVFYNCQDLKKLSVIPDRLSRLCFYNCKNLEEIPKIPFGLKVFIEKCPNIKISI